MSTPGTDSIGKQVDGSSSGNSSNLADPDIQRFANGLYQFDSDKIYGTFERSELAALPKSLFYDGATARETYNGLFAYYVLGKNSQGGRARYHISEKTAELSKITPNYSRNPTAKQIIETVAGPTQSGIPAFLDPASPFRGQIYSVKDFIFCKHYGIMPNNRMLTLRRFAYPTLDSLRIIPNKPRDFGISEDGKKAELQQSSAEGIGLIRDFKGELNTALPVSQAVTFFGGDTGNNLSSILGINTGLNFTYQTQDPVKNEQTGDPGLMNSPFGDLIKSFITTGKSDLNPEAISNLIGTLAAPEKNERALKRLLLNNALAQDGPLSKKIFVNVNTVDQIMTREQGFVGGTESFTLTFDYNLTSAGEVNSKLLFLDLMTNLLSLGSDYGQFLSPELRLEQTNVGLGFPGGASGYIKSIVNPIQYIRDQVSGILSSQTVNKLNSAEGGLSKDIQEITSELKAFVQDPDKNPIQEGSKFYKSIAVMMSDIFLKKIYYQPLMLSGYPTGEWHLVVGNPLNPIAMMGNLVCTNVKITFNDELGPDDFPTEMKAVFTLFPGRQRHRGDWESIFNRGNGRLYLGQLTESSETVNAWRTSSGYAPNDFPEDGTDIYKVTTQGAAQGS
jgi:hypothetical protein